MITTQVLVISITIYLFRKVLKNPGNQQKDENDETED
jgi:hypothetical protein